MGGSVVVMVVVDGGSVDEDEGDEYDEDEDDEEEPDEPGALLPLSCLHMKVDDDENDCAEDPEAEWV
jgi:hypothetical protein